MFTVNNKNITKALGCFPRPDIFRNNFDLFCGELSSCLNMLAVIREESSGEKSLPANAFLHKILVSSKHMGSGLEI